jgi:hypothetical protein
MEKKLSKPSDLTPKEKLQANYLKKLQQNTLNSAESAYITVCKINANFLLFQYLT